MFLRLCRTLQELARLLAELLSRCDPPAARSTSPPAALSDLHSEPTLQSRIE